MAQEVFKSYRDLKAWQIGMEVTRSIYQLTQCFPTTEQFGLTSQMRRACASIPANVAEGHARDSTKEFLHHLSIALGSLAELETFLELGIELSYCTAQQTAGIVTRCDELGRVLRGLQKALKGRL